MPSCSECSSLNETVQGLTDLMFNPSEYRRAYRENMEDDPKSSPEIFEVLYKELVEYSKSNPEFKKKLLKSLGDCPIGRATSPPRASTQSFSPRLRSTMIYTPRTSSRPVVN